MTKRIQLGSAELTAMERAGIYFPGARIMLDDTDGPDPWRSNIGIAMDAQPTLISTPNSGIPAFLTTIVDPNILRILTAKNKAAQILGEVRKGSWVDQTAMFPVVEQTGEVSSYGDYNDNGRSGANTNFPQRQSYLYQTIIEYGDLELERAGLAKINWAGEQKEAGVAVLNKFQNLTYFFGMLGLQNYGLLNDPSLQAPIAPAVKAAGGVKWFNGTTINATANEVYNDIVALYTQVVQQATGNVELDDDSPMVLAMSPKSQVALTFTNQFGITVKGMLKESYPNLRIESAVQYGALSATNPQGIVAGELVQLIAEKVLGQETGYGAYNEKLRAFPIFRDLSSYKQKFVQGTWGAIIRQPFAIAQMLGV